LSRGTLSELMTRSNIGIPALPGPEKHYQRPHVPVAEMVNLRARPAAGAADGVERFRPDLTHLGDTP
jgi:hypothetical protein